MAAAKTVGTRERSTDLSPAAVRYLLTIYQLSGGLGAVRSVDIAENLDVTRASVVYMLGVLAEGEFIRKRPYGTVQLTPTGVCAAKELGAKCAMLDALFTGHLHMNRETAHRDAIACLCSLSEDCIGRLAALGAQRDGAQVRPRNVS